MRLLSRTAAAYGGHRSGHSLAMRHRIALTELQHAPALPPHAILLTSVNNSLRNKANGRTSERPTDVRHRRLNPFEIQRVNKRSSGSESEKRDKNIIITTKLMERISSFGWTKIIDQLQQCFFVKPELVLCIVYFLRPHLKKTLFWYDFQAPQSNCVFRS